ncbi:MAG: pyruvate kinase [Thermodesulfobacteriota bacterium]|nr:pyruvate kinase [Thermodesulfobacteriota bacterium]
MIAFKDFRKTKIVCTLGPASQSESRIRELVLAGMDVARLNFSHGDYESHREIIRIVRRIAAECERNVGILQDLGGPKIRLGHIQNAARELRTGEAVSLVPGDLADGDDLPVHYPHLVEDVKVGDRILLADGLVELKVEAKNAGKVQCRVLVGGTVHSHKGVNLPSSPLQIAAFTGKDRQDLTVGLEEQVDFVALSFVRHESDLEPVRRILGSIKRPPLLIAKIEKPQALERFEAILAGVDGVMVARGDLGVETPLEEVPIIQKHIIQTARRAAKPVITATQMLRSMVSSPRPTRAEATDVANAILDGTDALMLSEETAMGAYPVESVQILHRIAMATEPHLEEERFLKEPASELLPQTAAGISRAACALAEDLQAAAIVASTASGSTARLISRLRPSCPVVGLTHQPETLRQLTLSWGVIPSLVRHFHDTDEMFSLAGSWVVAQKIARQGDRIILTAGLPLQISGTTNLLRVMEVE